ncbi:MAG: histidinol-phosphate transaminase [Saprospiraceae bacterium]
MTTTIKSLQQHFKSFLTVKNKYKGGKSIQPSAEIPKVYKLSSNEHPLGCSPKVLEAIRKATQNLHIYPDTTDLRLRTALVAHFDQQLEIDQFLTAASGSEIIDLTFRAFLKEEDEVIISTPCFVPYSTFSRWMGAKVVDVPLKKKSYQLDVDGILAAITDRTRIIALTSPNNPTGTYIPKADLDRLLNALPQDILIIYDEVYRHFADAPDYVHGLDYVKAGYPVIAVNSFSKTYGMAAMRLGYAYSTPEIANYIRQIIKPFSIPTLTMDAGIAALKDEDFVAKTRALILKERAFMTNAYQELGLDYTPSQANFFLLDPPIPSADFVDYLMQNGIMTRPVDNFGATGKVRISIGTREANEALVGALRKLVVD